MYKPTQTQVLRVAFVTGAITDTLAVLPMLFPDLARFLWGFAVQSDSSQFAMGYGASLMLGWAALLVWAYQKPTQRQFIALLTMWVIFGLAMTQLIAVLAGTVTLVRMVPTWCLQAVLLVLFALGYFYPVLSRSTAQRLDLRR